MEPSSHTLLESLLVPILSRLLDPWHHFLNTLPPWSWRLSVCLFLVVGTLWGLFLTKKSVFAGAPTPAAWRDLRWWLPILLLPYLLVYLFF
jgi:hypothetical protein